jgi:proteasome assembly chaperone (PAC2) family protein
MILLSEYMEEILYLEKPVLQKPYLVVGFEGWPNAAEVSTFVVQHLIDSLEAKRFASISNENFYQISSARPFGIIKEGRLINLKLGGNHLFYSKGVSSSDLILFQGVEPHLRWTAFADLLLSLAKEFGVCQIFTIGGTYGYTPHTYPAMVTALFNHESLKEKVLKAGVGLTEYSGPVSIHTFILEAAKKKGIKAISLWGHAPQYLHTRNSKVIYAVLQKLNALLDLGIDLYELRQASEYFEQQVNELVEQDPKLQEIINKLEDVYKDSGQQGLSQGEEERNKEEKVVYIRAFLKKQEDEEKKEGA